MTYRFRQADLEEIAAVVAKTVDERLQSALAGLGALPPDAQAAVKARITAQARGFYTVADFADAVGRSTQYISDRCRARMIRTLPGGKPYRIPLSEEAAWNRLHG